MPIPQSIKVEDYAKIADKLDWLLIDDYNVSASLVAYDGKVWIRICGRCTRLYIAGYTFD